MEIRLMQAAAELQLPYHSTLRLVLTGKLKGEQIAGRWFVDAHSLESVKRERSHERAAAATR
jgi:hypothetical protein